ncbi:MAG: OmpP1/FadL family transporter [Daejeonella sp.]
MNFRILLSMVAIVAATGELHAQYSGDALRFSQSQYGSTARFKAIGAQTGVGGDLSSVGGNPAGIGLFTRSEFSLTPEFNSYSADAQYLGVRTLGKKDQISLAHAAAVWNSTVTKPRGAKLDEGWISFNFGLGYNRTNAYGNNINYSGTNAKNSVADYYSELATDNYGAPGTLPSGKLEKMAYDNYLIGYDSAGYYFPETEVNNIQNQSIIKTGSQSEINFTFGGNYGNKLYVGASVGLAGINYNSTGQYTEDGYNVTEASDYVLSYRQSQITRGSGINTKIGAIFRPSPNVRLGATVQTPTWYTIDDSFGESLETRYAKSVGGATQYLNNEDTYNFTYRLRTPMKLSGGISYFFNNQGFISADVDYVDYSTINFATANSADNDVIANNNRDILNNYKSTVNYRIGAEYKVQNIMLRAGYGLQGNPYKNQARIDLNTNTYSGGLGYRINNYYFDLSYQNVSNNSDQKPYTLKNGTGPVATLKNTRNNVFFTVGSRF